VGTLGPIPDPADTDLPEHRGQQPLLPKLGMPARDLILADHLGHTFLPHRTQIKMVLQKLALQLTAPDRELILQLSVAEPGTLSAVQPADQPFHQPQRSGEPIGLRRLHVH